jgi:hypothetical protein
MFLIIKALMLSTDSTLPKAKQKPPEFSGGFAAGQDVSDFTRSAALIFVYVLFQKESVSV